MDPNPIVDFRCPQCGGLQSQIGGSIPTCPACGVPMVHNVAAPH